jgi:hypothetical protein
VGWLERLFQSAEVGPPHSAGAQQIPCCWHGWISEIIAAVKRDLSTRICQFNNSHAFRVALTDG